MPSLFLALVVVICAAVLSPRAATAAADGCSPGASSDFNGDGFADAVVADTTATVSGRANARRVVVFYGDSDGRIGEGARRVVQQGSGMVSDVPETGDRFGFALAAADLDCDDFTDLVVGSPYEDAGGTDSGLVQIVWGTATGLGTGRGSATLDPAAFGNIAHAGDQFGYAVDPLEDVGQGGTGAPSAYALVIGAPGWDVGSQRDAGWVGFQVAYDGDNVELEVTQDSPGIPGAAESGDRFGAAVSLGYLLGDRGTVDAAVGTPNEDIGSRADAGAVTIVRDLHFDPDGVAYDQNSSGVPGAVEADDRFGRPSTPSRSDSPVAWPSASPVRTSARPPMRDRFSCSAGTGPASLPASDSARTPPRSPGSWSLVTCSATGSCSRRRGWATPRPGWPSAHRERTAAAPTAGSGVPGDRPRRGDDLEPGQHRCTRRCLRG